MGSSKPYGKKNFCHICDRAFKVEATFLCHMMDHDQEKQQEFKEKQQEDSWGMQSVAKDFKCSICGLLFLSDNGLAAHKGRVHKADRLSSIS